MYKTLSIRSLLWNVLYYTFCVFAIFYLLKKDEIINWDVSFVFIPLIFLAFSTETLSKKSKDRFQSLRPYNYIDFVLKIITFIITQLIIRKIIISTLLWICICAVFFMCISSIVCSIVMIAKQSKNK